MVLKPSEQTPLTTLEIGRLARGLLPDGVLNVIGGRRASGAALVTHAGIDKISFTGSTATGVAIVRESAAHLRPVTLELGGNDAAILPVKRPIAGAFKKEGVRPAKAAPLKGGTLGPGQNLTPSVAPYERGSMAEAKAHRPATVKAAEVVLTSARLRP